MLKYSAKAFWWGQNFPDSKTRRYSRKKQGKKLLLYVCTAHLWAQSGFIPKKKYYLNEFNITSQGQTSRSSGSHCICGCFNLCWSVNCNLLISIMKNNTMGLFHRHKIHAPAPTSTLKASQQRIENSFLVCLLLLISLHPAVQACSVFWNALQCSDDR